jgi:hypothetical protein
MPLCKLEDWKDYLNENVTAHLTKQESCMSIKQLFEDHISVSHVTSNTKGTKHTELSGVHLGHYSDTARLKFGILTCLYIQSTKVETFI